MAQFDRRSLEHLKELCQLECSQEEEESLVASLQQILEYVGQLEQVDTEGVKPCYFVLRSMLKNQMRGDEVGDLLPRASFLSEAPEQIGGMIRVPPILKEL